MELGYDQTTRRQSMVRGHVGFKLGIVDLRFKIFTIEDL